MNKHISSDCVDNSSISIYTVSHKPFKLSGKSMYKPIFVGDKCRNEKGVQDNTGDNIAKKNPNYCELTALYWVWKNDKKSDFVGISHYRRYFSKNDICALKDVRLEEKTLKKYLEKYDIIVPLPLYMGKETIGEQYGRLHKSRDLKLAKSIIKEKYPDYLKYFDIMTSSKFLCAYNMMITNKKLYDEYCKWIFDILFELESKVDISEYEGPNVRVFGFLSERLFNVWLLKKKDDGLKIKYLRVFNTEDNESMLQKFRIIAGVKRRMLFK